MFIIYLLIMIISIYKIGIIEPNFFSLLITL